MSRVMVVAKRSSFGHYIVEERDPRAQALLDRGDPVVKRWRKAHEEHERTMEEVWRVLDHHGVHHVTIPDPSVVFDAADADLVIAVGGDGTLLSASHNLSDTPLLGVNSAPRSSVGFFCAGRRTTFRKMLPQALDETLDGVTLTRMQVALNGRVRSRRVLNEALYCHASPAATSRYILGHRRIREEQRSSGFWVGPAAGSTAAQHSAGGAILPLESPQLQLVVREPYAAFGKSYRLLQELVLPGKELRAKSKMQEGNIFLDGPFKTVRVRLGDEAAFSVSDEPLTVLGLCPDRSHVAS